MILEANQDNFTIFFPAIVLAMFTSPKNAFVLEIYFLTSKGYVIVIPNLESLENKVSFNFHISVET